MADQLYLSLWFPNFRLEALPEKLSSVMRQFALISGEKRVIAASVYPIGFNEAPTYQRIYVNDDRSQETEDSIIENAVSEATEQLHDDMAYEFEMRWKLWIPETDDTPPPAAPDPDIDQDDDYASLIHLDTLWKPQPATVRILGLGPKFDDASFEQNGHIRIDFGLDTPWLAETLDEEELDEDAAKHIQQNVEKLLAFTLSVEKHCG
ncbi:MAG TPA: hypothetical protein VIX90_07645, partial [Edaphobacter sp.]